MIVSQWQEKVLPPNTGLNPFNLSTSSNTLVTFTMMFRGSAMNQLVYFYDQNLSELFQIANINEITTLTWTNAPIGQIVTSDPIYFLYEVDIVYQYVTAENSKELAQLRAASSFFFNPVYSNITTTVTVGNVYQIGSVNTTSGVATVTFSPAFAGTPKMFCQITDGTEGIVIVTAKSASQFSLAVWVQATATFVSSITAPTSNFVTSVTTGTQSVAGPSHTHSVPSLSIGAATTASVAGLNHTHSVPALSIGSATTTTVGSGTHTHSIGAAGTITVASNFHTHSVPQLTIGATVTTSTEKYPRTTGTISSGGFLPLSSVSDWDGTTVVTTAYIPFATGTGTTGIPNDDTTVVISVPTVTGTPNATTTVVTSIPSTTGTGTSGTESGDTTVVTTIPSSTGTGTSGTPSGTQTVINSVSTTTSSAVTSVSPSTNTAVTGWVAGGTVAIDWNAIYT